VLSSFVVNEAAFLTKKQASSIQPPAPMPSSFTKSVFYAKSVNWGGKSPALLLIIATFAPYFQSLTSWG
jgi:hypothetical protein